MPDLTPAAEIRAAAALVRSHAEAASADAGTPWTSHPRRPEQADSVADIRSTPFKMLLHGAAPYGRGPFVTGPVGRWIALVDPAVGLLLAAWLDSAAEDAEQIGADHHALALARAINTPTEEPR